MEKVHFTVPLEKVVSDEWTETADALTSNSLHDWRSRSLVGVHGIESTADVSMMCSQQLSEPASIVAVAHRHHLLNCCLDAQLSRCKFTPQHKSN